jgi:hypothetical protein
MNPLSAVKTPKVPDGSMVSTESARAVAETQGAIVAAKQFPRDQHQSYQRIMQACKRPSLAGKAMYSYPRGGQTVKGPSIRLAEVILQNWGNMVSGITELSNANGESVMQSFAWDLETNTRDVKTFSVKHIRKTRQQTKKLDDPRDVYELVANQGARRKRACILAVIPADVVEDAVKACEQTVLQGIQGNLEDRVRGMLGAFMDLGVTKELIEKKLEHPVENMIAEEFVDLQSIYQSIKDGVAKREDFFDIKTKPITDKMDEMIKGKTEKAPAKK